MEKEFVDYNTALALKELGFDEPCIYYVDEQNNSFIYNFQTHLDEFMEWCGVKVIPTPTYSKAFRWFREKYGLCSWIERMYTADSICYYRYTCEYKKDPLSKTHEVIVSLKEYDNYEEAEPACLKKLIEIVKKQKI